ncbi:hypothetical protein CPT_Muldoon_047 [Serratia phage Muldoon]|uniref:Uncharacterized protein n=1 Tax=Serratia phage Muldoon TaxID=2601678 RepID=A0A5P8PH43_9CAUD|nr:hypothetical protein HYP94_gp046 [Serratia phage Muldoon]QFR56003.1 hypothetical protein CPT_Muldoon_047 [Serratia phage Muldoon]WDS61590.1 hypothetical protein [Cronobacter phage vB_Cdu_VP8]
MNMYELLVGQYEPKKMTASERKDKLTTRSTVKIGIGKPGQKSSKADSNYSNRSFKW